MQSVHLSLRLTIFLLTSVLFQCEDSNKKKVQNLRHVVGKSVVAVIQALRICEIKRAPVKYELSNYKCIYLWKYNHMLSVSVSLSFLLSYSKTIRSLFLQRRGLTSLDGHTSV